MSRKKKTEEEPEEPSRAAGACVLVLLAVIVVAVTLRLSVTIGVLALWFAGALALWRSARRMSDSSATPPPPSPDDEYAGHSDKIDRVQEGPGEGMTILYPVRTQGEAKP